ncbi:uncharacterized protein LOC106642609 [Copidosoma floridanum]|uniref:uncharacterized protein LOC106642609 n=1 Tax=Copidosoma floridanum TaxID=29053 RepID=UPI000C6FB0D1|nr:uncharacterized protein LOC106642609 [Copidosoma floridanum]
MPHHAVLRQDKPEKIRVVFNASQKDILIHPDDADWQRLVWRPSVAQPLQDYRALTVTYGTAPAPSLALRVLKQLAQDGHTTHPEASKLLDHQIYVDDILGGANEVDLAIERRDQLIQLMASAGMELGKWSANNQSLLDGIVAGNIDEVSVDVDEAVSTLGLKWLPQADNFIFKPTVAPSPSIITKRIILSETAKLFDPLGWLAPVIVTAKIMMQDLWINKFDWDVPIRGDLLQQWMKFRNFLTKLDVIKVPRWIGCSETFSWQLHDFADASKRAYTAAVYAVVPGQSSVLLMAKTKVAPTKMETLPRLELCGALLLVCLTKHLLPKLHRQPQYIHFWSDSKVVLNLLKGHPSRWQTFIANRVSEITSLYPQAEWRHVMSSYNAADCATRGLTPQQLSEHSLWWSGPIWMTLPQSTWPSTTDDDHADQQNIQALVMQEAALQKHVDDDCLIYLQCFSSFAKICRILAYCARWILNARQVTDKRQYTYLSAQELSWASAACFRALQRRHFPIELEQLQANKPLSKQSNLVRLAPYLDEIGLIRVGGRLENAPLPYSERHPIVLPGNDTIVKRLVQDTHINTLHGGVQLMLSQLYRTVWITRAHQLVTRVYRNCYKCIRHNQKSGHQQMAALPAQRVTPLRPFAITGIDYAGPIPVLFSKGRGAKSTKGYVVIFICFVVRAVHIEIVSDITTDAFMAAYDRFTARRGVCDTIYSDNATTFKRASGELARMFSETSEFNKTVAGQLATRGTTWKFIPPRAPHFGGLWEAAVRSFKYHFKRVIGDSKLTFEELSTLAAKAEACLNSRPLSPLSTEPTELTDLTPGHFLIGSSCLSHPEKVEKTLQLSTSNRWNLLCQMRNSFWKRWRGEVLQQLQQRNKW